jgi:hypothetical protein
MKRILFIGVVGFLFIGVCSLADLVVPVIEKPRIEIDVGYQTTTIADISTYNLPDHAGTKLLPARGR